MKRAALLLLLTGCAFAEGEPYGEVAGTLTASYQLRADRDVGANWQKLASDLELRVDRATLSVDGVELLGGVGSVARFDPNDPPQGYSLCHNGHCHHESGALVAYEDIEVEVVGAAAASASFERVAVDLLAPATTPLRCDPCLLDRGHVSLVRLTAGRVTLEGLVRDPLTPPRFDGEVPFSAELGASVWTTPIDLPLDDDHPTRIQLDLSLAFTAGLFDDVALAMRAAAGDIALEDDEQLRAAINEIDLVSHIERTDG